MVSIEKNTSLLDIVKVIDRNISGAKALLKLDNGDTVSVGAFAPVSKGDTLTKNGKSTYVHLDPTIKLRCSDKHVQIAPCWKIQRNICIMGENLSVTLKEIGNEKELAGYKRLTQHHYRGDKGVGRSVPIVATISLNDIPEVIGFIEITSSLLTNSARRKLFDSTFSDEDSGIAWVRWSGKTPKSFSNVVARISRCVVFPELRGMGISKLLCDAALKYCQQRWHIAGLRPIFLEITADMLRYHPFVKSAGFEYIGETAGNADRLIKDMEYLLKKYISHGRESLPQGGGGIMSLQISNTETLRRMMMDSKMSLRQVVDILKKSPDKLTDDQWIALHRVFRRPKHTYIAGLNSNAQKFITKRKENLGIQEPTKIFDLYKIAPSSDDLWIDIKHLSISSKISGSSRSRSVQESFGFVSKELATNISSAFDLKLSAGDVALITGPSGSGKSVLMNCLKQLISGQKNRLPENVTLEAEYRGPKIKCVAYAKPKLDMAPVDQFPGKSLETILKVLAITGLAEPHTFVRPARSLSEGQRYRLGIAVALCEQPDVLFLDAFCESIDLFSTVAVCKSLRAAARRYGFRVIAATARPEYPAEALDPTIFVNLTSTDEVKVMRNDKRN